MLFGEKFYPLLHKMPAWRHSLFALVLATRQYPNFALWCEVKQVQGKAQYLNALKACWSFHYHKFNHIDLSAALDEVVPFLPMELEEYSEGDSFAFDAAVMLDAALSSVPDNTKGAVNASQASLASVIRYCEHAYPENCATEDDLLELEPIQAEMDFQIELMEQVKAPRSPEKVMELCRLALQDGLSNIGLENELSFADFAPCFAADVAAKEDADASYEQVAKSEPRAKSAAASQDAGASNLPWEEQNLIVFTPEFPEGHTPDKSIAKQLDEAFAKEELTAPPSYAELKAKEEEHDTDVTSDDEAKLLAQLTATNERLGAEEERIIAQAQALAAAQNLEAEQAAVPADELTADARASENETLSEEDLALEFERIAETAALLEEELERELLLETGQDLDTIIAAGGNIPAPKEQKSGKDKKGHKHGKDGKSGKGKKSHQESKGDKPHKDGKGHKDGKFAKKDGKFGKDGKFAKDGKFGKDGKFSRTDKPRKEGKPHHKGKFAKEGKFDKEGKFSRNDKFGDKHHSKKLGAKDQKPKVFGAHAPKGKEL